MVDGSRPIDRRDKQIAGYLDGKKFLVVINKIDLNQEIDKEEVAKQFGEQVLRISTHTLLGLEDLKGTILERLIPGQKGSVEGVVVTHLRHRDVLMRTQGALLRALETLKNGLSEELIAVDVRDALVTIGEVTGETATEEILHAIFTEFCIGK
jgi:tRNA modification GTPase